MRIIRGLSTPIATLQVDRRGSNFELTVTFANNQRKAATVTTEHLKGLSHEGAAVGISGMIHMRRGTWRFGHNRGPAPRCVHISFAGPGSDLIIVKLRDLIRATGVTP